MKPSTGGGFEQKKKKRKAKFSPGHLSLSGPVSVPHLSQGGGVSQGRARAMVSYKLAVALADGGRVSARIHIRPPFLLSSTKLTIYGIACPHPAPPPPPPQKNLEEFGGRKGKDKTGCFSLASASAPAKEALGAGLISTVARARAHGTSNLELSHDLGTETNSRAALFFPFLHF